MGNYLSTTTKEQLKERLDKGINPNEIIDGKYPILFNFTNKKELELLLSKGADIDFCYEGKTALTRAALKDNFSQARLLLLYNANPNPIIKIGDSTVPWSTTKPEGTQGLPQGLPQGSQGLSLEMQTLLEIYGYPGGLLTEEIKEKMMQNIEECLKSMPTPSHYPAGYSGFIREDNRADVDDILNCARMYDHIYRNLDYNHVALKMIKDGFVFVREVDE